MGGYYYFKRYGLTLDGCEGPINFVGRLIRRIRGGGGGGGFYNGGGGSDAMYTGLAMESSTSFEPAFLPPAPSAVDPGGNPNAMGSGNYYISYPQTRRRRCWIPIITIVQGFDVYHSG